MARELQVGDDGTRSGWLADDGRFLDGPAAASTVDWRIAEVAAGDSIVLGEGPNLVLQGLGSSQNPEP